MHGIARKRIRLCLATPTGSVSELETIYAMEVLAPQCQEFIESLTRVQLVHADIADTPTAMERARSHGAGGGAVGPERAAIAAGLTVARDGVENPGNVTSFLLVAASAAPAAERRLLFMEVSSEVPEGDAIRAVLAPALRRSDYLAYDYRLEDKRASGEQSHLFLVSVSPPPSGLIPLADEHIRTIVDIGAAVDAGGGSY
ncbi:MAG: hypothetical protein M3P30_02045 [Chloroflexota bacterium]|nr:hypothetical protein [Chloroflexota bacterium]